MFSLAARRSLVVAGRQTAVARSAMSAALSTQAAQQVYAVEDLLMSMHWAHLKDNVEEIRHLLDEPKTNHSLPKDPALEEQVTSELKAIQDMILQNSSSPDLLSSIESRVCGLKKRLRSELYHLNA